MLSVQLPESFIHTVTSTFKDAGVAWLERLPDLVAEFEVAWGIRLHGFFPNLTFNFVAPCSLASGEAAVFKVGVPNPEILSGMAALRVWDGFGAVRLLRSDEFGAALLLERLEPGVSFWRNDGDAAVHVCADLLLQLWQAEPVGDFRSLRSWMSSLDAYHEAHAARAGPLRWDLVDKAVQLKHDLLASDDVVLLHADLHHDNSLSASRQPFLAIDPKGIVGPRGYDTASFLVNPEGFHEHSNLEERLERRLAIFSERLSLSKQELAAWAFVHCILSVCWSLESGQHPDAPEHIARKLNV